jgi:glycerol uptake facilitator-like aquaporin
MLTVALMACKPQDAKHIEVKKPEPAMEKQMDKQVEAPMKKVDGVASGLVVGGSLSLGIMLVAGMFAGLLNPAIAVGLGTMSWMYMLGPVVGGIVGAQVYNY